jgi:diguanylate cyclase (GGDEF)-like protein
MIGLSLPGFRRLRSRILLAFALLLIIGQSTSLYLVTQENRRTAERELDAELTTGERIVARLLEQERQRLIQAAEVLAADYGFREAVASQDAETITSALANHARRIGASNAALIGLDGRAVGGAEGVVPGGIAPQDALVESARRSGVAGALFALDDQVYQVVMVPVRAPVVIGWVLLGFEISDRVARDLGGLTRMEVSFVKTNEGAGRITASTLPPDARSQLESRLTGLRLRQTEGYLALDGERYGTRILRMTGDQPSGVVVALQMSLDARLAEYAPLRRFLLLLSIVVVVVSVAISSVIARGITRPLGQLARMVQRVRGGDYAAEIAVERNDEIGALAGGFDLMRREIALREQEILRLAYVDKLTGLPNRNRFMRALSEAIDPHGSAGSRPMAVLLMDLDRFRLINETLGHAAGDEVLQAIAHRLAPLLPADGLFARIGGDEFAWLLPHADGDTARGFARNLQHALSHPFVWQAQPVDVAGSVGLALFPAHGDEAGTLVRHADIAMYDAKNRHAGIAVFDPANLVSRQEHLSLLGELRHAIDADELRVFFQPKVDLRTGSTKGVEALVRWQHPQRGLVPPVAFIPYAEQTGFVRDVTRWVLEHAVAQAGAWHAAGRPLQVAVNLSTQDLLDPALPDRLTALLARYGVPPALLLVEITESSVMENPELALGTLRRIDALDVQIAIDDFGTGFSSLAYLKKLPVDELKIDRAFVMNMLTDRDDAMIVRSTVELAHNLGLRVVAEGVEDEGIVDALRQIGCDVAQGYFASRPLPADALATWLQTSPWGEARVQSRQFATLQP